MSDLKDVPVLPYDIDEYNKMMGDQMQGYNYIIKEGILKVSEPIPFLNSNYAGMTFNMWLVGMIANGLCSNPAIYDEKTNIVELSIKLTDAIIEKLQEEKSK